MKEEERVTERQGEAERERKRKREERRKNSRVHRSKFHRRRCSLPILSSTPPPQETANPDDVDTLVANVVTRLRSRYGDHILAEPEWMVS